MTATGLGIYLLGLTDHAVAVNLPEGSLNTDKSPAIPGQYITVYLTGQGATVPAGQTGEAAPGDPLALPALTAQATIGGIPAPVQFAGLAPGFVGVMQLNLQVPDIRAGEQLLQVTMGGTKSNAAVISVKAP